MTDTVILVDENDQIKGTMEKMAAHVKGRLHRAFSVFIFNTKGQLLMQQRAFQKYHSGGKWTNTCCSHPRPGEQTVDAANRRLGEEMGLHCELKKVFHFIYHAEVQPGITEYEYDHVFFGISNDPPLPDGDEVVAAKYIALTDLENDMHNNPDYYTEWLKICFDSVKKSYNQYFIG